MKKARANLASDPSDPVNMEAAREAEDNLEQAKINDVQSSNVAQAATLSLEKSNDDLEKVTAALDAFKKHGAGERR